MNCIICHNESETEICEKCVNLVRKLRKVDPKYLDRLFKTIERSDFEVADSPPFYLSKRKSGTSKGGRWAKELDEIEAGKAICIPNVSEYERRWLVSAAHARFGRGITTRMTDKGLWVWMQEEEKVS